MDRQRRAAIAKWVSVISSALVLGLWVATISAKQAQYGAAGIPEGTWLIGGWIIDVVDAKMTLLALLGILTTLLQKSLLSLIAFLLMFFPVGLYTLGVPGWARLIGIFLLVYLISSIGMVFTRYRVS